MRNLFSIRGRLDRERYLVGSLATGAIGVVLVTLFYSVTTALQIGSATLTPVEIAKLAVIVLLLIPLLWIAIAIGCRRNHDRGRSGWWMFLMLVPLANIWLLVDLLFRRGLPDDNKWGTSPHKPSATS